MSIARDHATRLADLLHHEHSAMADFLVALADFDAKCHWETLGYKSLFWFLHRELGLSKSAAFYRMTAAELIRDFPEVLEPLRDGRLCLSSVSELAKVLTRENVGEVLPRFFTLSKREAKEVTAELLPMDAPPLREVVTVVQAPALPLSLSAISIPPSSGSPANLPDANFCVPDVAPIAVPPPAQPASFDVEPLTADLRRLHLTVSKRLLDKLDAARDALSHSHPGASRDEIIEAGLDLLLERTAKRRGLVKNPRKKPPARPAAEAAAPPPAKDPGRYVPAEIRRAIWQRDQGRCQWPLEGGGICGSTQRCELDHIEPFAKGGRITKPEDGRILCRSHQLVSARRELGDACMDRFVTRRGRAGARSSAATPGSAPGTLPA